MIIREIGTIARSLESIANAEFRGLNLSKGQYVYLVRIHEYPGIIQEELSDMLKLDRSTVARGIRKLEQNDLVERVLTTENKKNKPLTLTEKGQKLVQIVLREHVYSEQRGCENLTEKEQKLLLSLLQKFSTNIVSDWEAIKKGEKRNY